MTWYALPNAGTYDDDTYNDDTDKVDPRKLKVTCPGCKRKFAPLCSKKTEFKDSGHQWVGCDYTEPYADYTTTCGKCRTAFRFRTVIPQ